MSSLKGTEQSHAGEGRTPDIAGIAGTDETVRGSLGRELGTDEIVPRGSLEGSLGRTRPSRVGKPAQRSLTPLPLGETMQLLVHAE
jgi:hypothetical protein